MEKTPAACAMEWSIELEKGIRSRKPGKPDETILTVGRRLEWLMEGQALSRAEYKMFGLVPGEDTLFANAILLRLADSFASGNKATKVSIAKIFLSAWKGKRRRRLNMRNHDQAIVSREQLEIYDELLMRVKLVFDTGTVEERALALIILGSWADFAKDNADMRYLILSNLVSRDAFEIPMEYFFQCYLDLTALMSLGVFKILEDLCKSRFEIRNITNLYGWGMITDSLTKAQASFFAAGCFCELADDFASVFAEILFNLLMSTETSAVIRSAGARAFAKLWISLPVAEKAYEAGLKLLSESSEEAFSRVLLISLTKIASKWVLMIPEQIQLLLSLLTEEKGMQLQLAALKCLRFILSGGVCHLLAAKDLFQELLTILNDSRFVPAFHYEGLKVLFKILLSNLGGIPCALVLAFYSKLLAIIETSIYSLGLSERLFLFRILTHSSPKILLRTEDSSERISLISKVISLFLERISQLVKLYADVFQQDADIQQEIECLVSLLLSLVNECPHLCCCLLDNVSIFVRNIVQMLEMFGESETKSMWISKVLVSACQMITSSLRNTHLAEATPIQMLNVVNHVDKMVLKSSILNTSSRLTCFLLLHSTFSYNSDEAEENSACYAKLSLSDVPASQHQAIGFNLAKALLRAENNWSAYKAGRLAACKGSWHIAALIFDQLVMAVSSDACSIWLKTLADLSHAEIKSQIPFHLPANWKSDNCQELVDLKVELSKYYESLIGVCNSLRSMKRRFCATFPGVLFTFQRWFLILRVKVVECLADLIDLLCSICKVQDSMGTTGELNEEVASLASRVVGTDCFILRLTQISYRFKRLAKEFDLLATFFTGDIISTEIMSEFAFMCSLLAFSCGFSFCTGNWLDRKKIRILSLSNVEKDVHIILIEDLFSRLQHTDSEINKKLFIILRLLHQSEACSILDNGESILKRHYIGTGTIKIAKYVIDGILDFLTRAIRMREMNTRTISGDAFKLLLHITSKWMLVPFQVPRLFFRLRPFIYSELFVTNELGQNIDGTSLSPVFHLPLNLCLQVKNIPKDLHLRKMYCILQCTPVPQKPISEANDARHLEIENEDCCIDGVMDLSEKLQVHILECGERSSRSDGHSAGACSIPEEYICFELSRSHQGFSSCLLDVTSLQTGFYKINWQSCCIDDEGSYRCLVSLNGGPSFMVQ